MSIRIALAQLSLSTASVVQNLSNAESAIRSAAASGAQLVVLPELTNSSYAFKSVEEARNNCCELDGPEISHWVDLAKELQIVLVAGVGIREGTALFNCSVIIDRRGLIGVYAKTHLFGNEPDFFTAGNLPPLVVDTEIGRLGTMICYDIEFPEWVRVAMLAGAQILALPTNWPHTGLPEVDIPVEVVRVQAAASQNKLVIAACDRTESEHGISWMSASTIIDYNGHIQAMATDKNAQIVLADVVLPTDDAIGPRNSIRADRRLDLYRKWLYGEQDHMS
jgi:predicted amidohydrolase